MQRPRFDLEQLSAIASALDQEERRLMLASGEESTAKAESGNVDGSGNFSLQVLRVALKGVGVTLVDSQHDSVKRDEIDGDRVLRDLEGFVCHSHDHWFCIRKINGDWFNLNSLLRQPERVSDFRLSAYLAQLRAEGWRIFLVRTSNGQTLPGIDLATSFADPSRIHMISDVLRGERSTGRPPEKDDESLYQWEDAQLRLAMEASVATASAATEEVDEDDEVDDDLVAAIAMSTGTLH